MTVKTSPYNPFDYLNTAEEINGYLSAAFADEDPRVFLIALGHLARKRGMSEVARKAGVNRVSLYKSLSGNGNPGYATIAKIARALGITLRAAPAH
jgi:probable addiction module antidote protein